MSSREPRSTCCCQQVQLISGPALMKSLADETSDTATVINSNGLAIVKDRYVLRESECGNSVHRRCWDKQTNQIFLCRISHEKYDKIVLAYFRLRAECEDDGDHHQLIRPVWDVVPLTPKTTYLIIPPAVCENLHSYIRDRRCLQEEEAKLLFRQMCEMVHLCHRNGIVLRDLKLRKFYFTDGDRNKLQYECLDGAVILDDPENDYLTEKVGCPLYVAPEMISDVAFRGKATDVWALGVMLYAMLTGTYPFNGFLRQPQSLFPKILSCQYYVPIELSSEASCLIRCLLRRSPGQRPLPEDILSHPWFKMRFLENHLEDHRVPEVLLPNEVDNIEFTRNI